MATEPQIGDIVLKRSFNFFGFVVRHTFPASKLVWPSGKYPRQLSGHNGIVGIRDGELGVFEASYGHVLFFTPWSTYMSWVNHGKCELKVVRLPGLTLEDRARLDHYLNKKISRHIPYDYLGALALVFDELLRRTILRFQSRPRWFCTEVILYGYIKIHRDFFHGAFPTPEYIEELVRQKKLASVGDFFQNQVLWYN